MTEKSPLWPAHLHHLCLRTARPGEMADWYADNLDMTAEGLGGGRTWLRGGERHLVVEAADARGFGFAAYALDAADQAGRLKDWLAERGATPSDAASPLFTGDQVSVVDPDGNIFVYGIPIDTAAPAPDALPGRLQHVGIATPQIETLIAFYEQTLGYRQSDIVRNDAGAVSACFLRCDREHHALALFAASSARFDHMCHETTCWNDIRDWGDHFAERRTVIEWGAARHGAGNNLFIFVRDPDANPVELSAELETRDYEAPPGLWKTEERTLNLWGSAWSRD